MSPRNAPYSASPARLHRFHACLDSAEIPRERNDMRSREKERERKFGFAIFFAFDVAIPGALSRKPRGGDLTDTDTMKV